MVKYESDDKVSCYFVIDEKLNIIRAWSDNKDYAKVYMEFHNNKFYKLRKVTKLFSDIIQILEENINDEINLYNINTKDKHHKTKSIVIPMTGTEFTLINDEGATYLSSRIDYGFINECMSLLKGKYKKGLDQILLTDVIQSTVYNKHSKVCQELGVDDLMVLYHSLPDQFG